MINIAGYVMGLTFIISHVGHLNLEVMGDNNLTISLILAHGWTAMLQLWSECSLRSLLSLNQVLCGQTSSSSMLTVGSYAAKLEFSESRIGAEDVSVQIQCLGADRWQGWSQRWGKQDLRTGIFGKISIWTITIMMFNNVETPAPFGVLLNCKEINLWAQILQNLFMAWPFSYLLCQCLASANAEKLSNVQCFRSKADECTGEVFAILNWDLKSRGVCRRWVL